MALHPARLGATAESGAAFKAAAAAVEAAVADTPCIGTGKFSKKQFAFREMGILLRFGFSDISLLYCTQRLHLCTVLGSQF